MQKIIVGMFIVLALAGCTSGNGDVDQTKFVDKDEFELDPNLGAIAGLLVDDLFRPIELNDAAEGQYQDIGFIFIQEAALEVPTNENGEFTTINLEPGRYTLRMQAGRHEAAPQTVDVVAGEFAELTIQARRFIEETSTIITQEQTMFTECSAETPVVSSAWLPCSADLSLEGARTDFRSNFSQYMDEASYMVVEATFNQQGSYTIEIRRLDPDTGGIGAIDYASCETNLPYIRIQMVPGEIHEQDGCEAQTNEFDMSQEFQTIMFAWSDTHETLAPTPLGGGVGVKLGVRAQVVQSLFLGEPEVNVDTYCVLCD